MSIVSKSENTFEKNDVNKRIVKYDFLRMIFMLMVLGVHVLSMVDVFSEKYNTTW